MRKLLTSYLMSKSKNPGSCLLGFKEWSVDKLYSTSETRNVFTIPFSITGIETKLIR